MAEGSTGLICPLEFRYGRPEVRSIFSREARLRRALQVEAALAASEADVGLIPLAAAEAIGEAARSDRVTLERVDSLEQQLRHDVMAIVRGLAEQSGEGAGYVHLGATSADITDTALAMELKESAQVLRGDLTRLGAALLDLARTHRATPEVGRTHGQHAVPMSFGYKMAVGAAEILRDRRRLDELVPRLSAGKMSGAVGTGAGFGRHAVPIEEGVMRRLGLVPDEAPTQVVGRDRIAELTNLLALISGSAERLATEVRNLQRSEIGEVAEPFDEDHQVGSSTMAQKRNPILSENVTSLARLVRAFALPPLENMALWHERDLTNTANERIVLPHAILLTDDLLVKLEAIFRGLEVRAARMQENLAQGGGTPMTENLMLALTAKGLPRAEAHELLRGLTAAGHGPGSLAERAKANEVIAGHFSPQEIDELLEPNAYVLASAAKTDRVIDRLSAELGPA